MILRKCKCRKSLNARCGQRRKWDPCSLSLHIFTLSVCDCGKNQSWWGDGRHLGDVTETINTILQHHWTFLELPPSKSVTTVPGLYHIPQTFVFIHSIKHRHFFCSDVWMLRTLGWVWQMQWGLLKYHFVFLEMFWFVQVNKFKTCQKYKLIFNK